MRMGKFGIFLRLVYAEWASLVTGAFSAILIVLRAWRQYRQRHRRSDTK